jgi:hypothetical protein
MTRERPSAGSVERSGASAAADADGRYRLKAGTVRDFGTYRVGVWWVELVPQGGQEFLRMKITVFHESSKKEEVFELGLGDTVIIGDVTYRVVELVPDPPAGRDPYGVLQK